LMVSLWELRGGCGRLNGLFPMGRSFFCVVRPKAGPFAGNLFA
jgi:hypothetical protein